MITVGPSRIARYHIISVLQSGQLGGSNPCGNGKQSDNEALKLMDKNGERADSLAPTDGIRSILL